jgi:hypothetical protein
MTGSFLAIYRDAILHVHANAIHAKGGGFADFVHLITRHVEESASGSHIHFPRLAK